MSAYSTKITKQSLSSLLCDHQVCESCHIVDRDKSRCQVGKKCSTCGTPSTSGYMYFHMNIHTLINLMQEAYHSEPNENLVDEYSAGKESHQISTVLFFCTLRESLLDNFLYKLCIAQELPAGVVDRLFSDNKFHMQKQNNLFPSLTGDKWKKAVDILNAQHVIDYVELDDFLVEAVNARNKFVHRGSKYNITQEMTESCIKNISPLINLYVGFHNNYIHPIYITRLNSNKTLVRDAGEKPPAHHS